MFEKLKKNPKLKAKKNELSNTQVNNDTSTDKDFNVLSDKVITMSDFIVIDIRVFYHDGTSDLFKNVGRIFRLPGALRVAVYDQKKSKFKENLIPLSLIKKAELVFVKTEKSKFSDKEGFNDC